jgi:uncharacterized protein
MPFCGLCHAVLSTSAPMICSRCRSVHYCSQACQRADWSGHKAACAAAIDYETAMAFFDGRDRAKVDAESLRLLVRAAKSGNCDAQYELGRRYETGEGGVDVNDVLAAHWYRKAAEAGHVKAQYNLGVCYDGGTGVEKDATAAVRWYRKAAESGHVGA